MKLKAFLNDYGRRVTYEKGEHVFHQGDLDCFLYVIECGVLKAYYGASDGKERVKSFLLRGDIIGSLKSILTTDGCRLNLVCLDDCSLLKIEFDVLYKESRDDLELSHEIIDFLIEFGLKKETREYEFLCLSPEERYLELLKKTPHLFDLVSQNEIAHYLGITPVGLSRIKKRVQSK